MSRIHRSKHDVTILKDAFPKEFMEPFMELFNMKEESKNQKTWQVDYSKNKSFFGPTVTDTPIGKKYRQYIFDKYGEQFDLILDSNHPNYVAAKNNPMDLPIYWGDFILTFPPGKRLFPHMDEYEGRERELRFNCLLEKPEEGGTYIIQKGRDTQSAKRYDLDVGDVIVFSPTNNRHQTTYVSRKSTTPRTVLSLSFLTKYFDDL